MSSTMPLQSLRVLDCTQIMAGPYCSLLLADMGANVIKIERPGRGDGARRFPPFVSGESAPFMLMNRNKRSVALDLHSPDGQDVFRDLASNADVLLENYRPGTLERIGLGYKTLSARNPKLIYCSISGFGGTGPYRDHGGFDLVAQAMSGLMSLTGNPQGPPVKVGVPITDLNAGMYACYGILAAYIQRMNTGEGQLVDTSLLEAGIAYTFWESAIYFATGTVPGPLGSAHRLTAPYQALRAMDGYIALGAANQGTWEKLCAALGREDLLKDPRFTKESDRVERYQELAKLLEESLRHECVNHWTETFNAAGVPAGPLYNLAQVYADPQVQARNMVVELDHPIAGVMRNIGIPVKLSQTPGQVRFPAPILGQHTEEVLVEHGFSPKKIAELRSAGVIS